MTVRRSPARIGAVVSAIAVVLLAGGCAPSPAPSESPAAPAIPARAEDGQGRFHLLFELAKSTWQAGEPIAGRATLAVDGGLPDVLGGSGGGVLGFRFLEIGGGRLIDPVWTADCARHNISVGGPIISAITKSGGWSEDDPDADFYREFVNDPLVRLPAGEWEITAIASFVEGDDCGGQSHVLEAPIRVTITPDPFPESTIT